MVSERVGYPSKGDENMITSELREIEDECAIFCMDLNMMAIMTDHLFTGKDRSFGLITMRNHPEPDGYRYMGGGNYGSTSR